jgi:hypothetical protein
MSNLRVVCFAFILAQMSQASRDALKLNGTFARASAEHDLVLLREAVEETHSSTSLMQSMQAFTNATAAKQGSGSLTDFFTRVSLLVGALSSAFASPSHPDFISIKSLHLAIIFAGINTNQFQAYLDKLSLDPSLTHLDQLDLPTVTSTLTTFANNQQARASNSKTTNLSSPEMTLQQAQHIVKSHNKKQQQQQQSTAGNALINTSPTTHNTTTTTTTNNNNTNTTNTKHSLWSESYPHTHARRTIPGPGNPDEKHCSHCAKVGHIYNKHGHSDLPPCKDIRPTATTSVDQLSVLANMVAMLQGSATQNQLDCLDAFADASCFDASILASMNTGIGASVSDADADDEARRACAGGTDPKN